MIRRSLLVLPGLRLLLPLLLLLAATADVSLRAIPPDTLAIRAWEAVTLFKVSGGPFAPNKHYVNASAYGDLASLGNLPSERRPHRESFTTGSQGLRSYEVGRDVAPAAIIFGDSFGAGASLLDEDTLGARLGTLLHGPVVFGGFYYNTLTDLASLPTSSLILLQLSERNVLPPKFVPEGNTEDGILERSFPRGSGPRTAWRFLRDVPSYSPLAIWAGHWYKSLQNDVVLPNPYRRSVARFRLKSGDAMLFLQSEVDHRLAPPTVNVESVVLMKQRLEASGRQVMVVLVPDKLSVYGPLLVDAPPPPRQLYIDAEEEALRAAGILVVNLLPALAAAARAGQGTGNYIYHLDDTHWNAAGVAAAAAECYRRLAMAGLTGG